MSDIRRDLVYATINRAVNSIDYNIYDTAHKWFEFVKQTILADNSLTNDEKTEAIRIYSKDYDRYIIIHNLGTRRICENCNQKCLATSYCEYCVQNYLKTKFSSWTSGNNDIDNLIQKCQSEALMPNSIIEWIPYNNLQSIEYLTKGGFSEIYTATWIDGRYEDWDSKKQQLIRSIRYIQVVLKKLENVESASQSWFEEAKSHLTISNKWSHIVPCYGLTQNPSNGNYMLVLSKMDINLREYLQQYYNQLTWKEKINITSTIFDALENIHRENSIHRDLHSGNILYSQFNDNWQISDLGFCGPADKPSTSIYGNLPYIDPEVLNGRGCTYKSDIYSVAMLMWEISSEQPPFNNHEHDCDLALNIINGMRPKIISEIPLKYKNLMEQCWDADPLKRPDIKTLRDKMREIKSYYQNNPNELPQLKAKMDKEINSNTSSKLFTSKIHKFENLPEPKNATKEEQEAFHSNKTYYNFNIPDSSKYLFEFEIKLYDIDEIICFSVDGFSQSSNQNNKRNSNVIEAGSTRLTKVFKKLRVNSKSIDIQNNHYKDTTQQLQIGDIDDEAEIHNNPNLHSEEQDELEIPDGKHFF
ncbi:Cdc15p [Rhizophagus irregularis DAOM 197198w]|uniref:Cdc15p n=1 Tax=Rhizophagus irregularis (strain DAOM 197198w) TaxID=1432141 RepID=A0A015J003_RHIIW|nr:Cdc15p [Rhizophagus irregularis DAOM 197198w]